MATITLILGESGTGKTASLRNFQTGDIAIVNVTGKPLPFRTKFETLNKTTELREIKKFMKETKAKRIIVDDCQYIMSFQYMRRLKENGWDKFNEIQSDFFELIDYANTLPDDVTVYFLSHIETKDDGRQKIKTIGKMLDEKITIEGIFTTVLKTYVSEGKYYFLTQNSGMDTVKSPIGMFPSLAIDNDLKYVDEKIRNYYGIGECKTDAEMTAEDARVKTDIEQGNNGRVKRQSRASLEQPAEAVETTTAPETPKAEEVIAEAEKNCPEDKEVAPFTVDGEAVLIDKTDGEVRQRRTRKTRN